MSVAENALAIQMNSNLPNLPFTVSGSGCTPRTGDDTCNAQLA